jgi:hypothetical protein
MTTDVKMKVVQGVTNTSGLNLVVVDAVKQLSFWYAQVYRVPTVQTSWQLPRGW